MQKSRNSKARRDNSRSLFSWNWYGSKAPSPGCLVVSTLSHGTRPVGTTQEIANLLLLIAVPCKSSATRNQPIDTNFARILPQAVAPGSVGNANANAQDAC